MWIKYTYSPIYTRPAILNRWYAYPWGYASCCQGVREGDDKKLLFQPNVAIVEFCTVTMIIGLIIIPWSTIHIFLHRVSAICRMYDARLVILTSQCDRSERFFFCLLYVSLSRIRWKQSHFSDFHDPSQPGLKQEEFFCVVFRILSWSVCTLHERMRISKRHEITDNDMTPKFWLVTPPRPSSSISRS